MKPDIRFTNLPKSFWAYVRIIGQSCGYSKKGEVFIPERSKVEEKLNKLEMSTGGFDQILKNKVTTWQMLTDYFTFRAQLLNSKFEPNLMDVEEAKKQYKMLKKSLKPKCPLPMNKQKGKKKTNAYFTCMINMLVEKAIGELKCNYDPRVLTSVTKNNVPIRTFSRRMDGAFPAVVNPVAIWEIKEYYYTTTFGSRVADGVYETLLDGMEIEELLNNENIKIRHYLMIDSHFTWWKCGKSYLCRIADMLHMGYIDEVLVGKEIITRLPEIVQEWIKIKIKNTNFENISCKSKL